MFFRSSSMELLSTLARSTDGMNHGVHFRITMTMPVHGVFVQVCDFHSYDEGEPQGITSYFNHKWGCV